MFYALLLEAAVLLVLAFNRKWNFLTLVGVPLVIFNLAVYVENIPLQVFFLLVIISFFIHYAGSLLTQYADRNYQYSYRNVVTGVTVRRVGK